MKTETPSVATIPPKRTDFVELVGELHAGAFLQKINRALSDVAEGVVFNESPKAKGTVTIEFTIEQIGDSRQVQLTHKIAFVQPTARGKKSETDKTETPLHCGARGRLTAYPETQESLFKTPSRDD